MGIVFGFSKKNVGREHFELPYLLQLVDKTSELLSSRQRVTEEFEGRVTKNLSQEFSRTESRILGALSKLDEFLLNPQVRRFSGAVPGTFRNTDVENQEPSGDRSQNDPHPEVEFSARRANNLTDSDPDENSHNCY